MITMQQYTLLLLVIYCNSTSWKFKPLPCSCNFSPNFFYLPHMWNYCNTMVLVVTTITSYYGKCLPHYIVIITARPLCLIRTNASCSCTCTYIYLQITKHETITINYAFVHNCSHVLTHNILIFLLHTTKLL
jgi:hypothetical protein